MKCASCKDMGVDCPFVAKGETAEEAIEKSRQHAMTDHKEWWDETGSKMSEKDFKEMTMGVVKDC